MLVFQEVCYMADSKQGLLFLWCKTSAELPYLLGSKTCRVSFCCLNKLQGRGIHWRRPASLIILIINNTTCTGGLQAAAEGEHSLPCTSSGWGPATRAAPHCLTFLSIPTPIKEPCCHSWPLWFCSVVCQLLSSPRSLPLPHFKKQNLLQTPL